jgi:two-component system chemotaxis sensor kinase CheA
MPEDRESAGKSPVGQVQLIAEETSNSLILEIKDDGGGLDLDAIGQKATELGLIAPGATMTPEDLTNFIFRSGVSTAAEVTDVSGRGVGMDAVKRSVEEAGGSINVETSKGNGSTFRISLPKTVTTRIMEGFLIRCNSLKFILPMNRVVETSRFGESLITTLPGGNKCLKRHENLFPLVSLPAILGNLDPSAQPDDSSVVVTINSGVGTYALHVDEVLGVQKVVAREIKGIKEFGAITGGALMGDGSIAFILDMDEIYRLCPANGQPLAAVPAH